MNVQKYLDRMCYDGPINADPETLQKLCACHSYNIPFDIYDMFGGKRKVLDIEKIYNDVVVMKRGGFCYESNGLFHWLLTELGFKVKILQAQGYVASKKAFNHEFDHMTLLVTCANDEEWLTDVGWGGNSFVMPLKFVEMNEQPQRNGMYRLRRKEDSLTTYLVEKVHKTVLKRKKANCDGQDNWDIIYKFDTVERQFHDFQSMCDFQQDDESSFLGNNTVGCINTQLGITIAWGFAICKKKYIDPYTEEVVSVRVAKDQVELKEMIREEFGINISFDLQVQGRDYTGFSKDQGCCSVKKEC